MFFFFPPQSCVLFFPQTTSESEVYYRKRREKRSYMSSLIHSACTVTSVESVLNRRTGWSSDVPTNWQERFPSCTFPSERNGLLFAAPSVCTLLNQCGQMWSRKPQNVVWSSDLNAWFALVLITCCFPCALSGRLRSSLSARYLIVSHHWSPLLCNSSYLYVKHVLVLSDPVRLHCELTAIWS